MLSLLLSLGFLANPSVATSAQRIEAVPQAQPAASVPHVPFYSQFTDISSAKWQKVGCGIASLAMVIDYYKPAVSVNTLLTESLALGAYQSNAGWTYAGLIATSKKYGMQGTAYDFTNADSKTAYQRFTTALASGPVIASVHYRFDPTSTIPHLVVIESIANGIVYYNDPAEKTGQKQISVAKFRAAWKQRYIVIRPAAAGTRVALSYP